MSSGGNASSLPLVGGLPEPTIKELSKPDTLLHIDSTTMQKAEAGIGDTDENYLRKILNQGK